MEQLTLDFEYVINEVIRNDAAWSRQFCSFSDYDIVILEVGAGMRHGPPPPCPLQLTLTPTHFVIPPHTLSSPQVCPETNQVIINIGLLLLAFPSPDEEGQLR